MGAFDERDVQKTAVVVENNDGSFDYAGAAAIASAVEVSNFPSDQLVHATNLDIAVSALRDALRGSGSKTLTDVINALGAIAGTVSVSNFPASYAVTGTFWQATQPVSGPLTDTQLRATAVPVSGTVTASGPLTDTQLRATAVPVSGTVTASGPLTDTQLRASVVPVSAALTGWTPKSYDALSSTKQTVSAAAGRLGGWFIYNPNTAVSFVQVFDLASGSVTVGSTAPTYILPIPPSSGANLELVRGVVHATAIVVAATTTATGSTAPSSALSATFFYS